MITKALIENFRETVKPFVSQILFGTNYESMGTLDCVEFERDFDEILDLALAGYEQKVNNAVSTLDGNKSDDPHLTGKGERIKANKMNNDLISRQAALEKVRTMQTYKLFEDIILVDKAEVQTELMMLPSAQPEPHEGTWVYGEDSTADCVDGYRCSQCGFFVPWDYNHKLIDYINDYAYCPNCGAKMKGATT